MRLNRRCLTLWDVAEIVYEEVEKVFGEKPVVEEVSNVLLLHMIRNHVKNMEVKEDTYPVTHLEIGNLAEF